MDPDLDYRFQTADGRLLTRDAAIATVPAGTADVGVWLVTNDTPDLRGSVGRPDERLAAPRDASRSASWVGC